MIGVGYYHAGSPSVHVSLFYNPLPVVIDVLCWIKNPNEAYLVLISDGHDVKPSMNLQPHSSGALNYAVQDGIDNVHDTKPERNHLKCPPPLDSPRIHGH